MKNELNLKNNEVIKNLEIQRKRLEALINEDNKYNNNIKIKEKEKNIIIWIILHWYLLYSLD